jgi:hypothetical protein
MFKVNEGQYETILINDGIGIDENHRERIDRLGHIERFNFSSDLSIWSNKYANMINGTDSTLWHPNVNRDEHIYTFNNDICRSVYVKYNQTRRNSYDISTYRYTLPDEIFANSSDNQGFCSQVTTINGTQEIKCLPNGLFSLSPCIHCKYDKQTIHTYRLIHTYLVRGSPLTVPLPIIASNPHFLAADRSIQQAIEADHRWYVFNGMTRTNKCLSLVVMNGSRRMQFNINVVNDSRIRFESNYLLLR